jgi:predicted TIM-barrel enzyme
MNFKEKRILGMIHLSGDEGFKTQRALDEIAIYEEEGLYGCIIENYHGSADDVEEVLKNTDKRDNKIKIGINILPNEYAKAFELVNKYKVDFIQLDYVGGTYLGGEYNDGGVKKIDIDSYFKTFVTIPSHVKVFGGVWPKYYTPVKGSNLENDIVDGLFCSDAIVVTGSGTGKQTPLDKIKDFRNIIQETRKFSKTPLIIGAGLDTSNVVEQMEFAEGAIVGSCFKPYKRTQEKVSRELVKEFMIEVKKIK